MLTRDDRNMVGEFFQPSASDQAGRTAALYTNPLSGYAGVFGAIGGGRERCALLLMLLFVLPQSCRSLSPPFSLSLSAALSALLLTCRLLSALFSCVTARAAAAAPLRFASLPPAHRWNVSGDLHAQLEKEAAALIGVGGGETAPPHLLQQLRRYGRSGASAGGSELARQVRQECCPLPRVTPTALLRLTSFSERVLGSLRRAGLEHSTRGGGWW